MARYTIEFARYVLGLRTAYTSLTAAETALLRTLAAGRDRVIEIGVFEGATSRELARSLRPGGSLVLVDPFVPATRLEKLLRFSFAGHVAGREVSAFGDMVRFVRLPSSEAAAIVPALPPADLVFIDADHSYEAVSADFAAWSGHVAPEGRLAFHDSRPCPARPDLDGSAGPVRLVRELEDSRECGWILDGASDSLSVFRRR